MSRRGFVLLSVLWTLVILAVVAGLALRLAATGAGATSNRAVLTRGEWAREACLELLLSRYAENPAVRLVDMTDLGRGTWCRVELEDAGARIDLNLASADVLRAVVGSDSLSDALLDWRDPDGAPRPLGAEAEWYRRNGRRTPRNGPLAAVEELQLVRGFEGPVYLRLRPLLAVTGESRVNLNAVPVDLLRALPGLGSEAVQVVIQRRAAGLSLQGSDQLASLLSRAGRTELLQNYQDLDREVVYSPVRFFATAEGGVKGSHAVSMERVILIPAGGRLAVIRRMAE
jgi:type II secretory pathway component PulK